MSETVVIDEGSAQAKVTFKKKGKIKTVIIPSRVEEELKVQMDGFSPSSYITEEGHKYTVNGDLDDTIPNNVPSYQTSSANRAVIHEALRVSGFSGKDVHICVTLPVGRYFGSGDIPKDEALIESKRANAMAGIEAANKNGLAKIIGCSVYPEALPALFELSRNEDGSLRDGFSDNDKTLIVDIGGATTDITVITPSGDIQSYDSIHNCGVLDIAEVLSEAITEKFDIKAKLPSSVLDQILRHKKFAGKDVSEDIKRASSKTLSTIARRLEKMVQTPTLLDKVMIVGGGALLMGKELADLLGVEAIIPENAEETISRGIYKLERLKNGSASQDND